MATLLLFFLGALADQYPDVCLEPGHVKGDYDSVEEVRGKEKENETLAGGGKAEDEHLVKEAILDVAYYLRRFKFSGHDLRYLAEGETPKRNLFVEFPSPPLRNIHWEKVDEESTEPRLLEADDGSFVVEAAPQLEVVKKNCEPSFVECVKYLQERVTRAVLPRHLDSLTITKQNGWSFITDRDLIKSADYECRSLLRTDDRTFNAFEGPLERFQWLTSASYYMCHYTMMETRHLRTFADDCDNYASCIQWEFGMNNQDVRGDNSQPFACATYSFCPDPCCPLKFIRDKRSCLKHSPCWGSDRSCSLNRENNQDFDGLTLNQWNVSCKCDHRGMRWESKSGMCVDIDECVEFDSPCVYPSETCKNLPGTYKCTCSPLGYKLNKTTETCEEDPILHEILYPVHSREENEAKSVWQRLLEKVRSVISKIKIIVSVIVRECKGEVNEREDF